MGNNEIKEVLSFIDENIYRKIGLTELAELTGYSPFYFSKLFSENMGISVTGYIRIRKLQYAMNSLLEGMKVLDVALMYSFESHEGFTRSFTQLFGSSPSTVRKYLTQYNVPEYIVPEMGERKMSMKNNSSLIKDMHQMIFEILRTSLEEAKEGYCTKIQIVLRGNGEIVISDNGRGIPLSADKEKSRGLLNNIFAGHPITNVEYVGMGDFEQCSMQCVNSLSEKLQVNVYRDGLHFRQDYARGIAQHEVITEAMEHERGTEITLKPDKMIFGENVFSKKLIEEWIEENVKRYGIKITVDNYIN